jgi:hypothetical protein
MSRTEQLAAVSTTGTFLRRTAVLAGLAMWEVLLALWLSLAAVLVLVVVGVPLLVDALAAVRSESARQRRLAWHYSGVPAEREDPPWPSSTGSGVLVRLRVLGRLVTSGQTWVDLLWHVLNPLVGGLLALAPISLVLFGVWGMVLPLLWGPFVHSWDNSWYAFVPLGGLLSTLFAAVVGVAAVAAGLALAEPCVRLHGRWVRAVLAR